jgi:hypothetical protein
MLSWKFYTNIFFILNTTASAIKFYLKPCLRVSVGFFRFLQLFAGFFEQGSSEPFLSERFISNIIRVLFKIFKVDLDSIVL